tara:strand:+ start:2485 stop:3219 length:735 start_codon:yes stop_codon:yes gene_type:complete
MTFNRKEFELEKRKFAKKQYLDKKLQKISLKFIEESDKYNYGYQWTWFDLPIIQLPSDILLTQEIIFKTKPDLIIETGIAWGGSVVYYASIMELIGKGEIIGVDTVLPSKNIKKIKSYHFSSRIKLIKGSSTDKKILEKIEKFINPKSKVMVILDSNHTFEHVYSELILYSKLVSKNCFLICCDTIVDCIPEQKHRKRKWTKANNPMTALKKFLKDNDNFEVDEYYNKKLITTYSPSGYLKKVK